MNVSFNLTVIGGTPAYEINYSWGDGTPELVNASGNVSHTYASPGLFHPVFWVNDSTGASVNTTVLITVVRHALVADTPTVTPSILDLGQPVTFSGNASGGEAPYNYSWLGTGGVASALPPGCADPTSDFGFSTNSTLTCTPTSTGRWSISDIVEDWALELAVSGSTTLTVVPSPVFVSLTASPLDLDAYQTTTLSAEFTGGVGPYSFNWSGLPTNCVQVDAPELICSPTVPGTYEINVTETDVDGLLATGQSIRLVVSPSLSAGGQSSASSIDLGLSVTFSVNPVGGATPYSYGWSGVPGCSSQNSASWTCAPSEPGTWNVTGTITDGNGGSINLTFLLRVNPPMALVPQVNPDEVTVGEEFSFSVTVLNGTAPYTYRWEVLPSQDCPTGSASGSCVAEFPGTWNLSVAVQDSAGVMIGANVTLIVDPAATALSGLSGGLAVLLGVGAAMVVAAVVVVVLIRRRGKAPPSATDPDPTPRD